MGRRHPQLQPGSPLRPAHLGLVVQSTGLNFFTSAGSPVSATTTLMLLSTAAGHMGTTCGGCCCDKCQVGCMHGMHACRPGWSGRWGGCSCCLPLCHCAGRNTLTLQLVAALASLGRIGLLLLQVGTRAHTPPGHPAYPLGLAWGCPRPLELLGAVHGFKHLHHTRQGVCCPATVVCRETAPRRLSWRR